MFRVTENEWVGSRTSMSGSDIVVTFEDIRIGSIQGISISVSREKGPIYVMGSEVPVSFSRGKQNPSNNCHVTFPQNGRICSYNKYRGSLT